MALLHRASLTPSKMDLLGGYLGDALTPLGSYRFDDPEGEVGIETHIVRNGSGLTLHLPLTYRAEPLAGADEWAIGKIEHSVLGTRWVYNACGDAVYVGELVRAILTGGTQVEQFFETDSGREFREPTAEVFGSGTPDTPVPAVSGVHTESFDADSLIDAGGAHVVVRHALDTPEPESTSGTLSGFWQDATDPVILAYLP